MKRVDNIGFMNKYTVAFLLFFISSSNAFSQEAGYWDLCKNVFAQGTSIPFTGPYLFKHFKKSCAPEILYSWQTFYKDDLGKFKIHPFSGYSQLYTWRTPMGTFGYGESQIRIKLKPGTKFKWFKNNNECKNLTETEKRNTVVVNLPTKGRSLSDYLLCSPEVVESWSKNTVGAAFEAKKEMDFILKNFNPINQTYDAYGGFKWNRKRDQDYKSFTNVNPYFPIVLDGGTDWSTEKLWKNYKSLSEKSDDIDGEVFFNDGVLKDERSHFETKVPSYFSLSNNELDQIL